MRLDGAELAKGTDYEVSYEGNVGTGTAKVTVTGIGDYSGTATATFAIARAVQMIDARDVTVAVGQAASVAATASGGGGLAYESSDAQVAAVDAAGTVTGVSAGTATITVTAAATDNYEAASGRVAVTVTAPQNPFSDVAPGEGGTPHAEDILWLASAGVTTGWEEADGTRTFRGGAAVVRQDMAAFLYRMAGSPAYVPSPADVARFADVDSSTPHAHEIWWLASAGISAGWDEGDGTFTFRGMDTVKRQDMAAFLRRLTRRMGADDSLAPGAPNPFSDVDMASTPHAEDVVWLASVGVTTGWEEPGGARTYRGMADVVRQDMAAFLHRLDGHIRRTRG